MIATVSGGTSQYFLSDRLSMRLVLDGSGNVLGRQAHLPFGNDFGESGTQEKHHFTSYERDGESGTDYAVNRQYSQSLGRFMRTDPERKSCDFNNPQSLNRYAYVKNDAVNASDPLGTDECSAGQVWWNPPGGGIAVCLCTETYCEWDHRLAWISENEAKYQAPQRPTRWSAKRCKHAVKQLGNEIAETLARAQGIVESVVEPFRSDFAKLYSDNAAAVLNGTVANLSRLLEQFYDLGRQTAHYLSRNGVIIDLQLGEHIDETFSHAHAANTLADQIATHCLETMNANDRAAFEIELSSLGLSNLFMAFLGGLAPDHAGWGPI